LLLTVLGELVVPDGNPVWTASLLYVLGGLGITEQTVRQTLARAADKGWITGERVGRQVRWSVRPAVTDILDDITQRVVSLNVAPEHWDGNGIFLNVTLPQEKRAVRRRLYSALSWAGFGNPAPGLWANPHVDRMGEVKTVIEELGLRESAIVSIGQLADACGSSRAAQIEPPPCTRARTTSTAGAPVPGEAIPLVTAVPG
jgi:phenylacetic acid degradation operon negative regulatory protein